MSSGFIAFALSVAVGLALFATAIAYEARAGGSITTLSVEAPDKQPTDAATRDAMEAIRARVIDAHTLITHRRMPVAAARQFASAMKSDAESIAKIRSEKLPPPDALDPVLQKITAGADAVAGQVPGREPIDGLVDIVGALEMYASTFDHPGWKGLQQQ